MSSSMLLDSALINPELISQNIDGHPLEVTLDEFLHPGCFKSPADPSWGSSFGRFGPRWDHFKEVPETFSLVRMVQVTSHYLHHNHHKSPGRLLIGPSYACATPCIP